MIALCISKRDVFAPNDRRSRSCFGAFVRVFVFYVAIGFAVGYVGTLSFVGL